MKFIRFIVGGILVVAGIMLALVGGLMFLLSLLSLTHTEWCTVTGGIETTYCFGDVRKEIHVQKDNGVQDVAGISHDDRHAYQTGDVVLVEFPFGPPYVLSGQHKLMHYLIDYPTLLAMGILVYVVGLWIGLGKRLLRMPAILSGHSPSPD